MSTTTTPSLDLDWMISVDDHVLEPPSVWQDRIPARYLEAAPRLITTDDGEFWKYEDRLVPTGGLAACAGKGPDFFTPDAITYADMLPGCYDVAARLRDMDLAGILASMSFPSFPRFCGQIFLEAKDKELALLCVRAYNDWMIDEWCAFAPGRFIPLVLVPLWDPAAAAVEIERCAAKGATAVAFSENPEPLGLPTIHDLGRYWDPLLRAAEETQMVICMHVGSSSQLPAVCHDAPPLANIAFGAVRTAGTMLSWLFGDAFERFPNLKIALSEGNIGWMSYFLERAEQCLETQRHWIARGVQIHGYDNKYDLGTAADVTTIDIRSVFRDHIFGCFLRDQTGIRVLDMIGVDNVMAESDYPHADTTWPNSIQVARQSMAGLDDASQYKILRSNAERLFRFTPAVPERRGSSLATN
jgi:predicted TIM-barrel fold metal-dependent hydrolase